MAADQFYLRYYVGHTGKYGHEFLEFEFRPDGEVGTHKAQGTETHTAAARPRHSLWRGCRRGVAAAVVVAACMRVCVPALWWAHALRHVLCHIHLP